MRHMSEPLTPSARFLHDAGTLALALVLIPLYLLLNHYWQSLILLVIFMGCCVLLHSPGQVYRRVMRRLPAEIPPWHTLPTSRHRLQDWRDILVRPTRSRVCGRTRTMCRRC